MQMPSTRSKVEDIIPMNTLKGNRILIIGVPKELCQIFQTLLEQHRKAIVQCVAKGQEALTLIQQAPPNLAFVYATLPDMDLQVFLKQVQTHHPAETLPVIVLGTEVSEVAFPKFYEYGSAGYLDLPRALSDLFIAYDAVLQQGIYYPSLLFTPEKEPDTTTEASYLTAQFIRYLTALQEPPFKEWVKEAQVQKAYRFTCLPTFAAPLIIKAWRQGDDIQALAKLGSGWGGFEAGQIGQMIRWVMSPKDWGRLNKAVKKTMFWIAPSWLKKSGLDGENWIFEGWDAPRYKGLRAWTPTEGFAYQMGQAFIRLLPRDFATDVKQAWTVDFGPQTQPRFKNMVILGQTLDP